MRRYFYRANPFMKHYLEQQLDVVQQEQNLFRAAMLAYLRSKPTQPHDKMYNEMIEHTMQEQFVFAQANHLEQLFTHFNALHKMSRLVDTLYEQTRYQVEGLVDPDKFPIWDTQQYSKKWLSGWPSLINQLKSQLGYQLKTKPSSLQHVDSGRGVYIECSKKIPIGTLLGFVPGKLYQTYKMFETVKKQTKKPKENYLHFPTGNILDMVKIPCHPCTYELEGSYLNPYALGEIVNHPAPRTSPNVCFQQITIPKGFFPNYFLKLLPYDFVTNNLKEDTLTAVGIFSIRELHSGEELFTNYLEHHVYPVDNIPEWLIEPPPASIYLVKNEYERVQWDFWTAMEQYALKHDKELYEKYRNTVKYQPNRVQFQNNGRIYRQLTLVRFNKQS